MVGQMTAMPNGLFSLDLDVASALNQGARERQEDALVTAFSQGVEGGFAVLSDGMGGHAAGDIASRLIVTEMFAELTLRSTADDDDVPSLLRHSVDVANECLKAQIDGNPSTEGMGGTVVATMVQDDKLHWISIGDSVLYLFRNGSLCRLNDDHSMGPQIDMMAEQGLIDEDTARDHPQRNCLTSALIGEEIPVIDCPDEATTLAPGDIVIVASDGLQYLPHDQIEALMGKMAGRDSKSIADALIAGVMEVGNPEQDNISLVILKALGSAKAVDMSRHGKPAPARSLLQACARMLYPGRKNSDQRRSEA